MAEYGRRKSSLLAPFGIGAITAFPHDETLMISGLDDWYLKQIDDENDPRYGSFQAITPEQKENFKINDSRLSERLTKMLRKQEAISLFAPPVYRESKNNYGNRNNPDPLAEIKNGASRFPLWHYCPECGRMQQIGPADSGRTRCPSYYGSKCDSLDSNKRPYILPERFISVCKNGHIEDFPIGEWVHAKGQHNENNKTYSPGQCVIVRHVGASASLSGITYECKTCGISRNMSGAFSKDALDGIKKCSGNRPWIGDHEECNESLQTVQRGASNVWFAHIFSSIYIPVTDFQFSQAVIDLINRIVSGLTSQNADITTFCEDNNYFRLSFPEIGGHEREFVDTIQSKLGHANNNQPQGAVDTRREEELFRKKEYDVLQQDNQSYDLFTEPHIGTDYSGLSFVSSVSLVRKLKETRAFIGFSRLSADNPIQKLYRNPQNANWLPAVQDNGEGIFIVFDREKLAEWSSQNNVLKRVEKLVENVHRADIEGRIHEEDIPTNPVYILLHTFTHCIINTLAIDCGYPNSSIKERIYSPKQLDETAPEMCGILIYTAAADAEGSLGGLVRMGEQGRLEALIHRAISESKWCAADPVCIDSDGQGLYGSNLAACHNCALLPETSCEDRNMFLDRGLMIGTLNDETLGFFNDYLI